MNINYLFGINTHYSLLQSTIKLPNLIKFAKEYQIKHIAITDINNLYNVYDNFFELKKNNINPIIGINIAFNNNNFLVIAKNKLGFQTIVKINNLINNKLEKYKIDTIISQLNENVFVILKSIIDISFFKDTKNLYQSHQLNFNNIPQVYACNLGYLYKKENKLYKLVRCIQDQVKITSGYKYEMSTTSVEELLSISKSKQIIENGQNIIKQIDLTLTKLPTNFAKFKTNSNLSHFDILKRYTSAGLKARNISHNLEIYQKRLAHELEIVNNLDFVDYFLVVHDYISNARKKGILVGYGRGSAAGSLISYCLGITNIDPIKYDLIFERFLNPDRKSPPDIDTDFQDNKREFVLDYLFEKYSSQNVAKIATFQTFKSKLAIRDVGRVMDISLSKINEICKLIPQEYDEDLTTYQTEILKIKKLILEDPKIKELFEYAQQLLGSPRQCGEHAAGIVITETALGENIPLNQDLNGKTILQFDMKNLEFWGLWKVDILGLKNLTIIKDIILLILKNNNRLIDLNNIPLDHGPTFKLLTLAETNGVFQLESYGMKQVLRQVRPTSIEDLATILSLYRPGPQNQISLFTKRKLNPNEINYFHPSLEKILKPTLGIIIYQEQVMQIASTFANFSMSEADNLRRAMSKKDIHLLHEQKQNFIKGASSNNHDAETSEKIFNLIEKFAGYGFNKSHAISYAMLSYHLAYLKQNFPCEFYACLLTNHLGDIKKINDYFKEALSKKIDIRSIDLNYSKTYFYAYQNIIYMPFYLIKGFGKLAIQKLNLETQQGKFINNPILNICRLFRAKLAKNMIINLIVCSDNFYNDQFNKTTILRNLDKLLLYASIIINDKGNLNQDLAPEPEITQYSEDYALLSQLENNSFGFNWNYAILKWLRKKYKIINTLSKIQILQNQEFLVICEKSYVKETKDKSSKTMAFVECKDETGVATFVFFSNIYPKYKDVLKLHRYFKVKAKMEFDEKHKKPNQYIGIDISPVESELIDE